MSGLVLLQLKEVTWRFSNMHMSMGALGIKRLVRKQLHTVTWTC